MILKTISGDVIVTGSDTDCPNSVHYRRASATDLVVKDLWISNTNGFPCKAVLGKDQIQLFNLLYTGNGKTYKFKNQAAFSGNPFGELKSFNCSELTCHAPLNMVVCM